ncbi:MAG: ABC transporter permease subunit [Spirochaetaceae bacterium]|nr:ABC transporter permease subunit [Spirochaetaceae bacterium]
MMRKARLSRMWQLYALVAVPLLVLLIFSYLPMVGLLISFQDFSIFKGFFGSKWVGFGVFAEIFRMKGFWIALRNTLSLNALNLVFGFTSPILLALLLNEIRSRPLKKLLQSTLYLPHFLSWAIIGSISLQLFSDNTGLVNVLIANSGGKIIPFLSEKWHWLFTYQAIGVWQNAGWGTIIYLSAMTAINPELYEAAEVDGAGRWQKMLSVTLPGIAPTMIILLILQIGRVVQIGFEQPYILGNDLVKNFSEVISTYVYQMGIVSARFNVGTAVGLFQSVVGLSFLLAANAVARSRGETGIW